MKIICINDKKASGGKLKIIKGEVYSTNNWENPITSIDSLDSLIYVFDSNNVDGWFVRNRFVPANQLRLLKLKRIINKTK
jgi:hypothetical protein